VKANALRVGRCERDKREGDGNDAHGRCPQSGHDAASTAKRGAISSWQGVGPASVLLHRKFVAAP
jgi:hypothetical protein